MDSITYRVCSLRDNDDPAAAYDLVMANLVLHYMGDLDTIYQRINETLRPDRVFLMNIKCPTYTAGVNQQFTLDGTWPVNNNNYSGLWQTDFIGHTILKYHHTLTQILCELLSDDFRIDAIEEAIPPLEWYTVMLDEMCCPMMLLLKATKEQTYDPQKAAD